MLSSNLELHNPLPHIFIVKSRIYVIKDLQIPFNKDLKFVSFNITNMYSKVPVKELLERIELMCNHNGLND
jgi:hypothetical protein